jgi:hypothetical protein
MIGKRTYMDPLILFSYDSQPRIKGKDSFKIESSIGFSRTELPDDLTNGLVKNFGRAYIMAALDSNIKIPFTIMPAFSSPVGPV